MTHRKPRQGHSGRRVARLGMLVAACTAGFATASPAGAASSASTGNRYVGIVVDEARATAGPRHRVDHDAEFAVRELGARLGVGARNRAFARSAGCSLDRPCRSVALSFQVVTVTGTVARLNAANSSRAVNDHCEGCQTFAGAYQFIVSTPYSFTLSRPVRDELARLERRLGELERSREPISTVRARTDSLAAEVVTLLREAVATAPRGESVDPLRDFRPTVTLRRHID
ncbi:hypothetical protein AB0K47_07040 [Streptomyces tirandamycinicus]|uniref:Uncharacterized protein n=1 Tax=Streptomyces tirandamycinicus TaxID=2174846 RepID=A0A2S1SRD7_9ACTN|nr:MULTISPECIES: hypothetical protein [Streptomyces]AWI28953.1 hypothetical protein DDW44_09290 [Streptomyces tirandamycinicus]MCY0985198.1 hypothetical protein [Streptomyces tirandamycinicus]NNJ04093.1 hypothetical protein [Streptomyces sp. PKU-MA01144]TFE58593.1 hypothetical protein E3E14_00225 [Streptomyces sp. ICN441]